MFASLFPEIKTLFFLVVLSLILSISDYLSYLNLPKSLLSNITIPIQYGLYKTSILTAKQFQFIILARYAAQENKALTEQLANVISENASLHKKLDELVAFKEQQESLGLTTFNLVAARPIGISRFLIIDRGSNSKLAIGQPVVYKDNLIGKIKEISPSQSKIMLTFDPDSKIAAFSLNQNGKAKGLLLGQYGVDMLLDQILHDEPIASGDLVYTEGTETEIPKGLVIGKIADVLQKDNEVFKQAKVKPIFDITNLDVVFVITN